MERPVTGAVDARHLEALLRSLDAANPQADILEFIDEMLVQMAAAEGGGGPAIRPRDGIPYTPGLTEQLSDKFVSIEFALTPTERRNIIEDMLKLLGEDGV